MENRQLSIIVPVYNMNHDNNLTFCLDSLINQTVKNYEIIAVNDASTDDSLGVLLDYEQKYPEKFKVVTYGENKRQGGAKNEGLKVATGDWIGFIDSDDWITPDFYEKLIKKANETGADIVGCNLNIVSSHTFEVGKIVEGNKPSQTGILDLEKKKDLFRQPGSMVIKIYKHSVIKENNLTFPEGIFYEDNCAARIWIPYFNHFEYINEPNYYYLQHESSTVHTITRERCEDRIKAMNMMLSGLKERNLYFTYELEAEDVYTQLGFMITLFSYMLGCKYKELSFVTKLVNDFLLEFPHFKNNKYFAIPDKEEEKMINLCIKSPMLFYVYYSLLWKYRNLKQKKGA